MPRSLVLADTPVRLTLGKALDVSYCRTASSRTIAEFAGVSERHVTRVRGAVTDCFLVMQRILLAVSMAPCQAIEDAPDDRADLPSTFAVSSVSFDEALHFLSVNLDNGLTHWQQASSWHVMVVLCDLMTGRSCSGCVTTSRFEYQRPPILLLGVGACVLFDALFLEQNALDFELSWSQHVAESDLCIRQFNRDGAYSNDKVIAVTMSTAPPRELMADKVCSAHKQKHVFCVVRCTTPNTTNIW
jgi:hypothetical protein